MSAHTPSSTITLYLCECQQRNPPCEFHEHCMLELPCNNMYSYLYMYPTMSLLLQVLILPSLTHAAHTFVCCLKVVGPTEAGTPQSKSVQVPNFRAPLPLPPCLLCAKYLLRYPWHHFNAVQKSLLQHSPPPHCQQLRHRAPHRSCLHQAPEAYPCNI